MKRKLLIVLVGAVVLLVGIQLVPVDRTNPPVVADFNGPADVESVVRVSCYDCHSNEVRWPWYSRVAPASWLVARDVEEARERLNFSEWGTYDARRRTKMAEEMWEEVEHGEMPLPVYLKMHRGAEVEPAGLTTLRRWAGADH